MLRALREHWRLLVFLVCHCSSTCNTTDNGIGDSGAESILRALQSNTSDISSVILFQTFAGFSNTTARHISTLLEI